MADIRKIISKCLATGMALQSAMQGKLTDVVLMLVISAEEFNKKLEEVKKETSE